MFQTPFDLETAKEQVRIACQRIAPLWPLQNFVAANPYLGLLDHSFEDACALMGRLVAGGMQAGPEYYRQKLASGGIQDSDLEWALVHGRKTLKPNWQESLSCIDVAGLKAALSAGWQANARLQVLTVAEAVDAIHETTWAASITDTVGDFCAAYYDSGQSAWRMPWRTLPLFSAWQESASLDAGPELLGLAGFRQFAKELPEEPAEAIAVCLETIGISASRSVDFLHKQLLSIRGWAGHVQFRVRENGMHGRVDNSLEALLAVRLAYDAALFAQFADEAVTGYWKAGMEPATQTAPGETLPALLWQIADEHAWERELMTKLVAAAPKDIRKHQARRPAVQAVFCIDVRSEVYRRALESASPGIDTVGFAGFFGVPIEYLRFGQRHGASQCPVLLLPKFRIREGLPPEQAADEEAALRKRRVGKRIGYSWNSFKSSAISCFSFVETVGLGFGLRLVKDTFLPSSQSKDTGYAPQLDVDAVHGTGLDLCQRIQLGHGILRHTGLGTTREQGGTATMGRLVLLCGHGSHTTNNPYGSGLDCGACGGHAGDSNARVAAAVLNDPEVRKALAADGFVIPGDTHFMAGLHNTTTDEVELFGTEAVPATHANDLSALQVWLKEASRTARRERAPMLGLDPSQTDIDRQVLARALDWAEVRPEWGLAGNAAFIAAPRARTQSAVLGSRVFLHNYYHANDPGDATLELIMTAPMVVANWINLQYHASTANNAVFGSGTKVTHNVTGTFGVCQGNGGDLEVGLPLQSVHNGSQFVHEPLRLHVMLEAPRANISAILAKHAALRELVDNGWLLLFAIEEEGARYYRYLPGDRWEPA